MAATAVPPLTDDPGEHMHRVATVPATLLVAALLAACGGSSGGSTTVAGLTASNHGTKNVAGAATITLEAGSYYFSPTVLKGTPGQHLTLDIKDEGGAEHNFSIDSQHINKNFSSDVTVNVTFPQSGVLSFYCAFHKARGMAGGLLVSGNASGTSG